MKKIGFVTLLFTCCNTSFSQATLDSNTEPTAVVSFSKKPSPSPLYSKVLHMCNNDEILAEKVILEIRKEKQGKHIRITTEADFANLNEAEKITALCESHIQIYINKVSTLK